MDSTFDTNAVTLWRSVLGGLRDTVRQYLVARQLTAHLPQRPLRVLDAGCGQGSQAIRLARAGHHVTGLDPSPQMLGLFHSALGGEEQDVRNRVRLLNSPGERAPGLFDAGTFDVVLCHGVLAYLPDPDELLGALCTVLARGGLLSLLTVNGDALAMSPGLAGDWPATMSALRDSGRASSKGAQSRSTILDWLDHHGLREEAWYGVRVFTENALDTPPGADITDLLAAEELACRTDPYRGVAAGIHTLAVRR